MWREAAAPGKRLHHNNATSIPALLLFLHLSQISRSAGKEAAHNAKFLTPFSDQNPIEPTRFFNSGEDQSDLFYLHAQACKFCKLTSSTLVKFDRINKAYKASLKRSTLINWRWKTGKTLFRVKTGRSGSSGSKYGVPATGERVFLFPYHPPPPILYF